ncbi:ABC transporter ATP-binding protein [Brucella pseudogrignonensis]|uniref:Capsular polysaccharide transport system ATP-binding protein n=1 Tax=Brucella pseudogrignonensis TaxID=419475 RepID=A0ABU1MF38_9HYPH|nr:ABC transporter ATP-binding protein [Brucella pseudogrignonensis]MDR6434669.1 capsular polysaccharide transport system ATP-binding protein [Brucella pseudogrignonensis]
MIEFINVVKSYPTKGGRRTVLNDVSCTFKKGQNTGVLGRNGAGKSTLFKLISGSEVCDRGNIIRNSSISWPLGFTGGFHGSLSARENIRFVSRIYNQDPRFVFEFVKEFSELGRYMDMPVRSYSSGMRARLAFGMSMAIDFDFYLIDEVIAVGDSSFKKKCRATLDKKREAATVILVSHSNSLLKEFCDRGAVLNDGDLIFFDSIDDAIQLHEENQKKAVKIY